VILWSDHRKCQGTSGNGTGPKPRYADDVTSPSATSGSVICPISRLIATRQAFITEIVSYFFSPTHHERN
jgi:hypothetical protein